MGRLENEEPASHPGGLDGLSAIPADHLLILYSTLATDPHAEMLRMTSFVDQAPLAMFAQEADGTVTAWNQAAEAMFGWSKHEVLGRYVPFVRPENHAQAEALRNSALAGHDIRGKEITRHRRDGSAIDLSISNSCVRDPAGRAVGILTIASDITDMKRTQSALELSEARRQTLLNMSVDWYWEQDAQMRFVSVEGEGAYAIRFALSDVIGKTRRELPIFGVSEESWREHEELVARRQPFRGFTYSGRDRNGRINTFRISGDPIFDESGRFTGYRGVGTDITELVRANDSLRLFRTLIDQLRDGIAVVDPERGRYIDVNDGLCRHLGYTRDELLALHVLEVEPMSGLPQWTDLLERARKAGTFVYESVYRRKNGASFPVEINLNLIRIDQEYVVKVVRDITARKAEEARIEHLAYHDPLTGLPNRSLVLNRLQLALAQAQRSGCMLAAIFLDLDRFKTINDTLGHPLGDALLKQAAQRLRQALREGDTVARVGGDEFLVLLPSIGHMEDAAQAARKILAALAPEFLIDGHELSVGASAGVVVCPRDGMDADTLLKHADVALYRAKEKGGNAYRFFDPEMNARAHHRLRVEGGLRHAIERGELEVHYQPQVDLRSGRISGAEALIRWRSAEHGLIPPAEFIPIAEDSGLILPLGEWCLTQACAQARAWRDAGLDLRSVSVNVSARQLRQPDLAGRVRNVLARTGLPATQLELEITESSVMLEDAACLQVLAELRQSGVRIALDDFGTGYSSLAQLRHLPLDRVKIDRSFLTWTPNDRNDAGVVQLIIAIGRQLGLGVVAEGVETRPQLEQLLRWNCDTAQGYFFAEPMAAHALTALLDTRMNWLTPVQQAPGTEREQERFMR